MWVPFFSDNVVLVSRVAHFYYETNIESLIIPTYFDSGHPPFYGLYIALVWLLFGKSLAVSHWAVLPFLIGIAVNYYHIARWLLPKNLLPFALLLLVLEPTLLAQSVTAGLDLALVFGYLTALNGIIYRKRGLMCLAFCLMAFVNIRGIIGVMLIFCCDWIYLLSTAKQKQQTINWFTSCVYIAKPYILPTLLVLCWYYYHYIHTGFTVFNENSGWAHAYTYVDAKGFLRNIGIIIWRFLDFGRVFLWLLLGFLGMLWLKKRTVISYKQIQLLLFSSLPLLVYIPMIGYRTIPILHRYFIVFFLLFSLLLVSLLPLLVQKWKQHLSITFVVLALLSGHLWVYPDHIAQGWDASLACLPYFEQQQKMLNYIEKEAIPFEQVATVFPAYKPLKYSRINNDMRQLAAKDKKPLREHPYVLYSNVMNDFSDEELLDLKNNWEIIQAYDGITVYSRLYKNRTWEGE